MLDSDIILGRLDDLRGRREERRRFMKLAAGAGAAVGGLSLLAACGDDTNNSFTGPITGSTPTPTPTSAPATTADQDVLNFALNLEYLEAQFYSFAANGVSLPGSQLGGTGTPGAPTGGQQVKFTDPVVAQYAREIAADEAAHVAFLRSALGGVAVAQPDLDISAGGAFTAAAKAAGLVSGNGVFDPYASDENFLLAAFIFEDVGVTAYKGSATLLTNKTYVEAAAGILAAEAYHAGLIRTTLYRKGLATPSLRTSTDKISDARDSLDGTTTSAGPPALYADDDQGISSLDGGVSSNIVPTDNNGIAFGRSAGQVLNVVYLNKAAVTAGGFFPRGVNGTIKTSAASG